MTENLEKAWNLFIDGHSREARQLVEDDFHLETCQDFSYLNLMAYLYLADEETEQARAVMMTYINLARQASDKENEHIGLHQLAMIYREQDDWKQALELIEEERQIILETFSDDALKQSVNAYERGYLKWKLGLTEEGLSEMKASLTYALETDDEIAQACAHRGLGEIYASLDDKKVSKQHFLQALTLFDKAGDDIGKGEVEDMMRTV